MKNMRVEMSRGKPAQFAGWNFMQPLSETLKAWHSRPGWSRARAAQELGVPLSTYNGWCAGKPCQHEKMVRKLIDCIGWG